MFATLKAETSVFPGGHLISHSDMLFNTMFLVSGSQASGRTYTLESGE